MGPQSRSASRCATWILSLAVLAGGGALAGHAGDETPAAQRRPNIVLILVDDMGYSDLGCYGGEIRTPHIDRLATRGAQLTHFYVTPKCAPTRNALLSGLYPPPVRSTQGAATIAELLRGAGYATFMVGKTDGELLSTMDEVLERGFEHCFGNVSGGNYFRDDDQVTYLDDEPFPRPDGFYKTDAETDFALRFIEDEVEADQPFFLYLAYHAPHWPLHAKPEDIERYRGRYLEGPEAMRRARYARMLERGILDERWRLSDSTAADWDTLNDEEKAEAELRMAVHAAMIDCVDQNVGRLVGRLEELERLDDTLILFLSDNGACRRDGPWGSFIKSRFGYDYDPEAPVGTPDSHFGIGRSWANACNTPFRKYKKDVEEGGIASPLLVSWPGRLEARGAVLHTPAHVVDILPTCLEAAGVAYPESLDERRLTPLDGASLLPLIEGKVPEAPRPMFWYWEGSRAVRFDGFKATSAPRRPWKLYDMRADRTELVDLASERPDLVEALEARWQAWFLECHGRAFDPRDNLFPARVQDE